MKKENSFVRILHRESGQILAEGKIGWDIFPFEGNFYIRKRCLRTAGFKSNFLPGICPYKFLYVWMDFHPQKGEKIKNLAWKYWLPNPLFPFIWYRVAVPAQHPALQVERFQKN